MKSLVIGKGQIGQALFEIFSKAHDCFIRDVEPEADDPDVVEVLHICYPDGATFVDSVVAYKERYHPRLTIIHSSVAVGTTRRCGKHTVHSPERGRFPNLAKEMLLYRKFIGGLQANDLAVANAYLTACNWETEEILDPDQTELLKLISNVHMGLEIAWRQEVDRFGCDAVAYQSWEETYRQGYMKSGQYQLIRPIMNLGPIGGHCILNCLDLLAQKIKSKAFEFIGETNGLAKRKNAQGSGYAVSSR